MKNLKRELMLGIILIFLSFMIYFQIHIIFKDSFKIIYENFFYQLAFLPIYVLLVAIIFERLQAKRESENNLRKTNVLIGSFYREFGKELLKELVNNDENFMKIKNEFKFSPSNFDHQIKIAIKTVVNHKAKFEVDKDKVSKFKIMFFEKKECLYSLMQSSNLLEHEDFTDLVLAVFHLHDELSIRKDINHISEEDYNHLNVDFERAYAKLLKTWIVYLKHLKKDYPYLFLMEIKTNPLIKE